MHGTHLLEQARAGDGAAIEALLARHQPDLRRFARGMCRAEDADDAVQHTLVQLATRIHVFRGTARLMSWLFTIVKRECMRLMRVRRPSANVVDRLTTDDDPALALALRQALEQLAPELREVLLLRIVAGWTGPETAAELGLTLEAMKSRLHRGRAALRAALTAPPG